MGSKTITAGVSMALLAHDEHLHDVDILMDNMTPSSYKSEFSIALER